MTYLVEGNLRIRIPDSYDAHRFDGKSHGLTHCMKAVDFIVESDDEALFIEIKDPDDPNAMKHTNAGKFMDEFSSGALANTLKQKFRDSFLYVYLSGRATKPIKYIVLINSAKLTDPLLLAQTDQLKRQLPISGPKGSAWAKPFVRGCAVMNLAAWNRTLPHMPAEMIVTP